LQAAVQIACKEFALRAELILPDFRCDPALSRFLILQEDQQKQFYNLHHDRWIRLVEYEDRVISADDIDGWKDVQPISPYEDLFSDAVDSST
jgi:hypothetical protein